jgi:hypothetical protein
MTYTGVSKPPSAFCIPNDLDGGLPEFRKTLLEAVSGLYVKIDAYKDEIRRIEKNGYGEAYTATLRERIEEMEECAHRLKTWEAQCGEKVVIVEVD